jgi:hypothetical protein
MPNLESALLTYSIAGEGDLTSGGDRKTSRPGAIPNSPVRGRTSRTPNGDFIDG